MARFEELEVWKRFARLSAEVYKALGKLKDYGFRDQITRSGLSIPSTIMQEAALHAYSALKGEATRCGL